MSLHMIRRLLHVWMLRIWCIWHIWYYDVFDILPHGVSLVWFSIICYITRSSYSNTCICLHVVSITFYSNLMSVSSWSFDSVIQSNYSWKITFKTIQNTLKCMISVSVWSRFCKGTNFSRHKSLFSNLNNWDLDIPAGVNKIPSLGF